MEDDDLTTDTVATKAVLTPDGLCVKHPHVRLRGRDAQGHVVHRDSCYECDREFALARRNLQERQQELDRQLLALDTKTPGGGGSGRKKSGDTSVSSHGSLPAVPSPYPYYPPPPQHYYPGYGHPPYPGAEAPHYPPGPYGYPPPPPPIPHSQYPPPQLYQPALTIKEEEEPHKRLVVPGPSTPTQDGAKSTKEDSQLVALLQQKEQEMKELRQQLKEQQDKLTSETVALTEARQQLEQQAHVTEMLQTQHSHAVEQIQASFQQQLQGSNQQLEQQTQVTDLLQKQLEQLQLAFQQQLQALVEESKLQRDQFRKLLQEELAALRHAVKEDIKTVSSSPVMHATVPPAAGQQVPPPPAPLPNAATASTTPKLDKPKVLVEPDDLDVSTSGASEPDHQQGTAKSAKDVATKVNGNGTQLKKAPNHPWTSTTTNVNATVNPASNGHANANPAAKLKKPPDALGHETDEAEELHLSADESLWSASNDLTDKETNIKQQQQQQNYQQQQHHHQQPQKQQQPQQQPQLLKEKPLAAASDRFTPKYVHPGDDDDDISHHPGESVDERSLEQTVASSTYGEDRQKVVSKLLLDPYGDKGVYTGFILRSTGMPHGMGRMIYDEDGRIYEGDWRHGRWHGYGRASFSNGDSYEGEYKFDQRHGRGIYKWNDGRIYDGHFSEDKRHGHGVFTWPDGAVYDGNFVNGQREGHGKYTFADGGQYEGAWKDGRYDGFGTCTWEDGRKYRGEWRNGMAHGHGVETYPNGNIRHEGQWEDDEPVR